MSTPTSTSTSPQTKDVKVKGFEIEKKGIDSGEKIGVDDAAVDVWDEDVDVGACRNVGIDLGAGGEASFFLPEIEAAWRKGQLQGQNEEEMKNVVNSSPILADCSTGAGDTKKVDVDLDAEDAAEDEITLTDDDDDEAFTVSDDEEEVETPETGKGHEGQEKEKVPRDPFNDSIVPGLYRAVLVPSEDNNDIDILHDGVHFPRKGAFVEVLVKGLKGNEVIYPERSLEYFIGDGFLEGLPYGVDAALTHFRRGEHSLLTITERDLMQPVIPKLEEPEPYSPDAPDFYRYYVTLKKFENLPEVPEEYSIDDRLVLCGRLNIAAKKLLDANELTRSVIKYDFIRKNLDDFAILVKQVPQEFGIKRMVLLLKSLIGVGSCLLKLSNPENCLPQYSKLKLDDLHLSSGSDPAEYAKRALVLKPDSVDALLLLADIHLLRKEPKEALDLLSKVHELQPNTEGIRVHIIECIRILKLAKIAEMDMATRMLGLNI